MVTTISIDLSNTEEPYTKEEYDAWYDWYIDEHVRTQNELRIKLLDSRRELDYRIF